MTTVKPECYVASPMGFSEVTRYYYENVYLPALEEIVTPMDPWALTTQAEVEAELAAGRQREFTQVLGKRNIEAMRASKLCVAHLDGQELDSGTASEVGYCASRMPVFGIRSDFRSTGEHGATVNLQVETFIVESGGAIVDSLDALLPLLRAKVAELAAK